MQFLNWKTKESYVPTNRSSKLPPQKSEFTPELSLEYTAHGCEPQEKVAIRNRR